MPPENSYVNFTIPSDIEFYRSFSYFSTVNSYYSTDRFFNLADYPDYPITFRFKVTKKKIKTLEIE